MIRSLLISVWLLMVAPVFAADMVAKSGDNRVRLTREPCPVSVIKVIPEGQRGYFSRAYAQINGHEWEACWATRSDGMVLLVYSDGDQGLIGLGDFRQDDGV